MLYMKICEGIVLSEEERGVLQLLQCLLRASWGVVWVWVWVWVWVCARLVDEEQWLGRVAWWEVTGAPDSFQG